MVELERSRDAAEAASRAKSVFLANMSHEFRTPLNAILGFTQLMGRDAALSANQHENVAIIDRSGEHLLGLINDVLELSKIEAGRTTIKKQSFDLHRLLYSLEEMFQLRAADKGLVMELDVAMGVPRFVRMDEGKLRQVLMNLLGNAVKFTQRGGIVLRVRSDGLAPEQPESDRSPAQLRFEVEDTGTGIAPEEMDALFDPFVQTASGQRAQEGTGLGLPISQQFVILMSGEIQVTSALERGSTFSFEVPAEVVDARDVLSAQPARRAVGLEPGQPAYRLLVVDDKELNRRLLVKLLLPLGFEIREAANGQEAIATWEQWEPHLIWMDMRMPVMDGYEATRRIKATIKGQATVIVALTASALEEDRAVILSEGCDAYIRKPFREAELFDTLTEQLGVRLVFEEHAAREQQAPGRGLPAGLTPTEQTAALVAMADQPADWLADLWQATLLGNLDHILATINRVRDEHPAAAEALAGLARSFEHDALLALIQQAGGEHEPSTDS